jgi:hypothetical protein
MLSDEERLQCEVAVQSEINTVEGIQDRLRLAREVAGVTALAAAITGGNTSTPTNKWNDAAGDIFSDLKSKLSTVEDNRGLTPNAVVIGADVLRKATESPAWRDRVKYTVSISEEKRIPFATLLADAIGLENPANVFVVGAFKNTAARGATASVSRIWGENVLLFRKEEPSFRFNGLGLQLRWAGSASGTGFEVGVERQELAKADAFVVHDYYQDLIVNSTAAHWFTNTIT